MLELGKIQNVFFRLRSPSVRGTLFMLGCGDPDA